MIIRLMCSSDCWQCNCMRYGSLGSELEQGKSLVGGTKVTRTSDKGTGTVT